MTVAGLVLAGGLSRRMGGGDKGLRPLAGRPMLAHVIARLAPQVGPLAINANSDPAAYAPFDLPVLVDIHPGFAGPLAGVLTGLAWAESLPGVTHVATAATDTPFFPRDLVGQLQALAGSDAAERIVMARSPAGRHPVFGLWPVALRDDLARFLTESDDDEGSGLDRPSRTCLGRLRPRGARRARSVLQRQHARGPCRGRGLRRRDTDVSAPVFGITGWKNSGKTTLTCALVTEFTRRGLRVATIKHAHHGFDIDREGADSFRHRAAGAAEVAIVSGRRWALMHELRDAAEPGLADILSRLSPCDLVLIEGYKREAHPKIELRRRDAREHRPMAPDDPTILAVAADHPVTDPLPVFALDDITGIADLIAGRLGLGPGAAG